jgi:DNA polymerase-4
MFGLERQILHLRVASFPVAVYLVKDPSLRWRPLVVSAGRGARAAVLSVSEEARQEGIRAGMMLADARHRCRRLLVLPPDPFLFERAERALGEIVARFSPMVEPVRGGRFFLDLTGTGRLLGPAADTARRIQKEIAARLRLGPNAGLGINKLISGVAARVQRSLPLLDVQPGREEGFLSPLAVGHLPAVEPAIEGRLLDELNIRRVAELRAIDLPHLSLAFRSRGVALYRQARGIDESPVRPPERVPSVEEDETLPGDTNDDAALLACLLGLAERCGARLRRQGRTAGRARLAARYTDGTVVSRAAPLAPPVSSDAALWSCLRPLFEQVVGRRGRVRDLMVRLTDLTSAAAAMMQMSLFDAGGDGGAGAGLENALDRIRGRFGDTAVRYGRRLAS